MSWPVVFCHVFHCAKDAASYREAVKFSGEAVADDILADAARLMRTSAITKASACLLDAFGSKQSLDELRAMVQAEIRELRQAIKPDKEKAVLHAAILARVASALAMKPGTATK